MEKLTVHKASYKPIPLEPRRLCRDVKTSGRRVPIKFDTSTVYKNTYLPWKNEHRRERALVTKDHSFPGDGVFRYETTQGVDYSAKPMDYGRTMERPNLCRSARIKVPMESDTSTRSTYQKPPITEPYLRVKQQPALRTFSRPMETTTVHRNSYKPFKLQKVKTKVLSLTVALYKKPKVPMEQCTSYQANFSTSKNYFRKDKLEEEASLVKKAHDYS